VFTPKRGRVWVFLFATSRRSALTARKRPYLTFRPCDQRGAKSDAGAPHKAICVRRYLLCSLLESLRKSFDAATDLHILLFPYLLYPSHQTAMTGSVFTTVAVAFERYTAVHYPVSYSQSMSAPNATRRRLIRFVIPAFILSLAFNVPKFLEAKVEYYDDTVDNVTTVSVCLSPASFWLHYSLSRRSMAREKGYSRAPEWRVKCIVRGTCAFQPRPMHYVRVCPCRVSYGQAITPYWP